MEDLKASLAITFRWHTLEKKWRCYNVMRRLYDIETSCRSPKTLKRRICTGQVIFLNSRIGTFQTWCQFVNGLLYEILYTIFFCSGKNYPWFRVPLQRVAFLKKWTTAQVVKEFANFYGTAHSRHDSKCIARMTCF